MRSTAISRLDHESVSDTVGVAVPHSRARYGFRTGANTALMIRRQYRNRPFDTDTASGRRLFDPAFEHLHSDAVLDTWTRSPPPLDGRSAVSSRFGPEGRRTAIAIDGVRDTPVRRSLPRQFGWRATCRSVAPVVARLGLVVLALCRPARGRCYGLSSSLVLILIEQENCISDE